MNRRYTLLLALLIIASVVMIWSFFTMTPTYLESDGNITHYEDDDISFNIPATWTVYEYDDPLFTPFLTSTPSELLLNPSSGNEYSYYNGSTDEVSNDTLLNTSATNATDVVIVQTQITKVDSLPEGISIEEAYKSDSIYQVMAGTGNFELNNQTTMDINGDKAYEFVYTVTYTKYQDIWIEHGGSYYRILSQAPITVYSTSADDFDVITDSFQIK